MATIREIAAQAGVSTATVSNVLNNTRKVSGPTRESVLEVVRQRGYTQNALAKTLVTGRSDLVGLLISDLRNPFFPDVAAAFQEQGLLHEVDALVMNTEFDARHTLNCVKRLLRLRVPGIALMTSQTDPLIEGLLIQQEVCAVYLDLGTVQPLVSNLVVDYENGIEQALDHLRSLGHHRVGFIEGTAQFHSIVRRRDAFLTSAAKNGGMETLVMSSDFTMRGGYVACSQLLSRFSPTAIVAVNDVTAIGAMHCAYDRGLRVPADLSLIGFDDISFAEFAQPALTTVRIPRTTLGVQVFRTLWAMIQDPEHTGSSTRVETELIVRGSTAPPKSA